MSVLFVTDALAGLEADVDASVGLMAATQRLGDDVWVCTPEDLSARDGRVLAQARRIGVRPRRRLGDHRWSAEPQWWDDLGGARIDVAAECALVHLRIDPPVDERYLHTTYLLDLVEDAGTRVVNRPEGVRALHEKLIALRWPHLCPPTLVSPDLGALRDFVAEVGNAVVKPVDGFAGRGVWRVRHDDSALALLESATSSGTRHVIAQAHLPAVEAGNKRLFLLDGEVVGTLLRRPLVDDFRIGPPVSDAPVAAADHRIVAAVGPVLVRHGIALAGLDVIGDRLIEVNVTCPGGMAKADALLGTDLCGDLVRRLRGDGDGGELARLSA